MTTRPLTENEKGMLCEVCEAREAVMVIPDIATATCKQCMCEAMSGVTE